MTTYTPYLSTSFPVGATNSGSFALDGDRGAKIWVDTTNINGGTLTVKLQHQSPGGTWVDVTGATTAAIATNTATVLYIYPGITAAANATVNIVLGGGVYRVVATAATATVTAKITVISIT